MRPSNYGASHGDWSKYKALSGMKVNTTGNVASVFILNNQIQRELKEKLTYDTVLNIVKDYGISEKRYKANQYNVEIKLMSIIDRCERMNVDELEKVAKVLKHGNTKDVLLFINKGKPIINKSF